MAERRLFDGACLRATLLDPPQSAEGTAGAPARRLMVTLDFRKVGRSGFQPAPRSSSFAGKGYAQLSIQTRANDWFINPETRALEAALPGLVAGFDEVRMLGYSMGGYGAFRLAKAVGASFVMAISPQASIDPAVVPFDRRYRAEAAGFDPALGDLSPVGRPDLEGLIVLDPFVRADLRHAWLLQRNFPRVRLARLNFGGHPAIRPLRDADRAWTIHAAVTQEGPAGGLGAGVQAAHRAIRRQSWRYWDGLARKADARRPELAATARAQAARLRPEARQ